MIDLIFSPDISSFFLNDCVSGFSKTCFSVMTEIEREIETN